MKLDTVSVLLLSASCLATSLGFAQVPEPLGHSVANKTTLTEKNQEKEVENVQSTPEAALQNFMVAMASSDLKKLKLVSHPHQDIELLMPNVAPPAELVEQMKAAFLAIPITSLKVGDTVKLPSGHPLTFDESQINDNNAILTFPNNPYPFPAIRIEGVWKINPKNIIAVRKAAIKVTEERKNSQDAKPKADLFGK